MMLVVVSVPDLREDKRVEGGREVMARVSGWRRGERWGRRFMGESWT